MRFRAIACLALFHFALAGCSVEVDKKLVTFCNTDDPNTTCRTAQFAGPDWDDEPIVFLDSATGEADTVLVSARSSYMEYQQARIPKFFPKRKYADLYVERFAFQASGFRLPGRVFSLAGDAKSLTVLATWGAYRVEQPIRSVFSYSYLQLPGRPGEDEIQRWTNVNIGQTGPVVLSAEFLPAIGLYKLRVGPYNGVTSTYVRQNLWY